MRLHLDRDAPPPDPWLVGLLAPLGVLALLAARSFPFSMLPTMCTFKALTGQPCLACGMTRSWIHLVHGHPLAAIAQNPLGSLLAVATIAALGYAALRQAGLPALRLQASHAEAWTLRGLAIAAIMSNWVYVATMGVA